MLDIGLPMGNDQKKSEFTEEEQKKRDKLCRTLPGKPK